MELGNLHLIFVHIPIGALIAFSIIEIIFVFFENNKGKDFVKFLLLLIGLIGGFLALQTGEILEEVLGETELIEQHAFFSELTIGLYSLIFIGLAVKLLNQSHFIKKLSKQTFLYKSWNVLFRFSEILNNKYFVLLLNILGLGLIFFTGFLGGSIAHKEFSIK